MSALPYYLVILLIALTLALYVDLIFDLSGLRELLSEYAIALDEKIKSL